MRESDFNECPECGKDIQEQMSSHDPLGEGEEMDIECDCGKQIMVSATYSVDYYTWKAPCLNQEAEHKYEVYHKTDAWTQYKCVDCGSKKREDIK